MSDVSKYEVRCPSCDVSFPIETKRCVHCGSKTAPSQMGPGRYAVGGGAPSNAEGESPAWTMVSPETDVFAGGVVDEEDETPRRTLVRSAGTLIWVAMLIGFSLLRACSEE